VQLAIPEGSVRAAERDSNICVVPASGVRSWTNGRLDRRQVIVHTDDLNNDAAPNWRNEPDADLIGALKCDGLLKARQIVREIAFDGDRTR